MALQQHDGDERHQRDLERQFRRRRQADVEGECAAMASAATASTGPASDRKRRGPPANMPGSTSSAAIIRIGYS